MPLLFCSAFLLFSSSFIHTVAVAASFDRNENHDNRRNEHADRKKDRSKDRQAGRCVLVLYFTASR